MQAEAQRKGRARIYLAAAGGVIGLGVGFAYARFEEQIGWDVRLGGFETFGLLIASMAMLIGVISFAASFSPRMLASMSAGGDGGAASPQEAELARLSGLTFVLAGVLAALPVLALVVGPELDRGRATAILVALGVGTAVQMVLNLLVWRRADELLRRATLEGAAAAFLVFELGLFLWGAAELMGLVQPLSAWAIWTIAFSLYFVAAVSVSARRGLG